MDSRPPRKGPNRSGSDRTSRGYGSSSSGRPQGRPGGRPEGRPQSRPPAYSSDRPPPRPRRDDRDALPITAPRDPISPWVQIRGRTPHPFVYRRMMLDADRSAKPGDIVAIYDRGGELFGHGMYNPNSEITLRVLTREDAPPDAGFWRVQFERAIAMRKPLIAADTTDAYRLIHAEGDGLSGLVVDAFAEHVVIEAFALGIFQRWRELAAILKRALPKPTVLDAGTGVAKDWTFHLRADDRSAELEGFGDAPLRESDGPAPGRLIIREHGVRYRIDLQAGHKTGFFCDQRENRRRLARFCDGADVLDLCSYTGGFGLCAKLLGNARHVISVDLDEQALAIGKENANLNQVKIDHAHADAFIYLRQMITNNRQFDVVVLDPPKLARSRAELEDGFKKYRDLNKLALQAVRPGGLLLTCSCSGLVSEADFLDTVSRAAYDVRRPLQLIDRTGADIDHPVMLNCPESAYLKALWLRVL